MTHATLAPIHPVPVLPSSTPTVPGIFADVRHAWEDLGFSPWRGGHLDTPHRGVVAAVDPEEEEDDIGDEEDLAVTQPTADDESSFDDFDDEFDDDFEEEENDPDWDHPDDGDAEPPPGKPPGRKK